MSDEDLWRQQLGEGSLSQNDFDSLMKSKESLEEMDKLKERKDP